MLESVEDSSEQRSDFSTTTITANANSEVEKSENSIKTEMPRGINLRKIIDARKSTAVTYSMKVFLSGQPTQNPLSCLPMQDNAGFANKQIESQQVASRNLTS